MFNFNYYLMKISLLFCLSTIALIYIGNASALAQSDPRQGARKMNICTVTNEDDTVISVGTTCTFGWDDCLPNPCPSTNMELD